MNENTPLEGTILRYTFLGNIVKQRKKSISFVRSV